MQQAQYLFKNKIRKKSFFKTFVITICVSTATVKEHMPPKAAKKWRSNVLDGFSLFSP